MTPAQLQNNIKGGLERLRRSYDACIAKGYNRAMLQELAQSLRYWADMKGQITGYMSENKPDTLFCSFSLTKKFRNDINGFEYVVVNYPKLVTTTVPYGLSMREPDMPRYDQEIFLAPVTGGQKLLIQFTL